MFGKLKDKLKQAVSIFSKKTEEEAVIEEKLVEKKDGKNPAKKKVQKKEIKKKQAKKDKANGKKKAVKDEVEFVEPEEAEDFVEKKGETRPIVERPIVDEEKETEEPKEEESLSKKKEDGSSVPRKSVRFLRELFGKKEEEKAEVHEVKGLKEIKEENHEEPSTENESFFGKIKTSLTTKKISAGKFEELFWELELALLENNVSVEVIEKIKEDLKVELVDKPLPRDVLKKIEETLRQTLTEILSFERIDLLQKAREKEKPLVIAFFGINGTGKTTSIAKLAHYFRKHKLSVVLAACDTFRAAAIQQLEEHADKLGVKIIKHDYGADAAAVAFDAIKYAEKNKIKVVLLDTAGRLHSNTNLMQELEKIIRVAKPDLKIFVGESITGNDCIEQAKKFNDLVEMDGAILTKADVDEKGGAPLSISYTIKKPILFLGIGQKYEDLEEFDAAVILKRLGF